MFLSKIYRMKFSFCPLLCNGHWAQPCGCQVKLIYFIQYDLAIKFIASAKQFITFQSVRCNFQKVTFYQCLLFDFHLLIKKGKTFFIHIVLPLTIFFYYCVTFQIYFCLIVNRSTKRI